MTQAETRNIGYGLAASVAIHILLLASMALWMNSKAFEKRLTPPVPVEEPSVTLVFADAIEEADPIIPEPETVPATPIPLPSKSERYIRTTQNQDAANAPEKADFVSDRNTIASSKMAASPDGDAAMPTTDGVGFLTNELANRDYKDGDIKNDSAPSPPPTPATPPPSPAVRPPDQLAMRQPDPPPSTPPPTNMAKKTDSPMEDMMQQLDQQLATNAATENPALEIRRAAPVTPQDMPPSQPAPAQPPTEATPPSAPPVPVPRAIPMPDPIANTPNPQEDAFQPHTRTASNKGTISNRGALDAVNAAATPTGRYMRQVTSAIEKKWHTLRNANKDFVEPGRLRIRFYVNKAGNTEDITILDNKANAVLTDFSLTAILKAEVPPIPKDLLPILEKERVEIEYDIVIY